MGNIPQAAERTGVAEPPSKFLKVRISDDLWERLNIAKIRGRTTIEQICNDAIARYLNKEFRHAK